MKPIALRIRVFLIMLFALLSAKAYDFEVDGIYYNIISLDNLTCEVTYNPRNKSTSRLDFRNPQRYSYNHSISYPSYSGDVVIPSKVNYKGKVLTVKKIGEYAFLNCSGLKSLSIPSSISEIEKVVINSNYGYYAGAFDYCNIETLTVGSAWHLNYFDASYALYSGCKTKDNLKKLIIASRDVSYIPVDFREYNKLVYLRCDSQFIPEFSVKTPFSNAQYLNTEVLVPEEAISSYQSADVWKDFWELKVMKRVKSIALNEKSLNLEPNQTIQLRTSILPEDAFNKSVAWTSSNTTVASVDAEGNVTAKTKGDAVITVKSADGSNVSAQCPVHVDLLVKEITFSKSEIDIEPGETKKLIVTIKPDDAFDKHVIWESDAEDVATVDQDGNVIAKNIGVANISVRTTDGSNLTANCKVSVTKSVKEIHVTPNEATIKEGESLQLSYTILPEDASDKTVVWSSSNTTVASVDAEGNVTAKTKGDAVITVTSADGSDVSAQCSVHVVVPVKEITLSESEIGIESGETKKLIVTIKPDDASDKHVIWESDAEDVATVDQDGNVTAKNIGVANISVRTTDGSNLTANCKVSVTKSVKEIHVIPNEATIKEGESLQLSYTILPEDASDKTVVWSSSNTTVASVDAEGNVTAKTKGDAVITVTSADGSDVSAQCSVHVVVPVKEITLSESEIGIESGETKKLIVTIKPDDAFDKHVIWESDAKDVATVDQDGNVTAKNIGVANISVRTTDGSNLIAKCKVIVAKLIKTISIAPNKATIEEGETLQLSYSITPETATYKNVIWKSDNVEIASVDENGKVSALLSGTTRIIAVATDGSEVSGECVVTVKGETVKAKGICYQRNSSSTLKIVANPESPYSGDLFIPEKADFKGQEMSVTEIGPDAFTQCKDLTRIVIPNTIKKIGETTFKGCSKLEYVKICDGSSLATNVDIMFPDSPITELYIGSDGITYEPNSRLLGIVKCLTLGNSVKTFPPLEVFNSLESFIIEDGDAPIVEPEDYCTSSMSLINQQTPKDPDTRIFYRFFYLVTYTHLSPIANAIRNKTLNYLHIGREIQRVKVDTSKTQEIIPTSAGSRYQEFGYKDEVNYSYNDAIVKNDYNRNPVESLSFDKSVIELNTGESVKPVLIFAPKNASFTSLEWSSSNEDVAVVDIFGNVTKLQDGEAIITATTTDGTNLSATCKIVDKGSGITDVLTSSECCDYTVYNLQGILILKTADANCIKELPTGIYIINGKKVMIK